MTTFRHRTAFKDLRVGDTVELSLPHLEGGPSHRIMIDAVGEIVESPDSVLRASRTITGQRFTFAEVNGWEAVALSYAGGLPNAPAIMWTDEYHLEHIASRTGHPANGVWIYNGVQIGSEELIERLDGSVPNPMDFR